MTTANPKDCRTTADVARELGFSRQALWWWINRLHVEIHIFDHPKDVRLTEAGIARIKKARDASLIRRGLKVDTGKP